MDKVVKALAPNMPEDRHVKGTRDVMTWYKVVKSTKTLLVPPMNVLKTNMRELERFSEAVQAFAVADLDGSEYRWGDEDLVLDEVTGAEPEKLCEALKRLPDLARQFDGWIACDIETRRVEWEDNMLLSIGFAYVVVVLSLEYIPFIITPLSSKSSNANAKHKSLPVLLNALYLTMPTFCKHFSMFFSISLHLLFILSSSSFTSSTSLIYPRIIVSRLTPFPSFRMNLLYDLFVLYETIAMYVKITKLINSNVIAIIPKASVLAKSISISTFTSCF